MKALAHSLRATAMAGLCIIAAATAPAQVPNQLIHSIPAPPTGVQSGALMGSSVGVDVGYAVVGAPSDDIGGSSSGVVKVFDTTTGALLFLLPNPSPADVDDFGTSVAISGTRVVVGAPHDNTGASNAGSAYVYDLSSGTPTVPVAVLNNPGLGVEDYFGLSVAISGMQVVVGAPGDDTGAGSAGSAYVYDLSSGTPTVPVATLNNPAPAVNDSFGNSVAISGTRVVVGANGDDTGATNAGSAYVYDLSSGTPTVPVAILNNPGPAAHDFFGISVAISGARVVVGAHQNDTGATDAGSAYVYDLSSGTPTVPAATLNNPSPVAYDRFGYSVAISGARVVVGANGDDTGALNTGSAYVYDVISGTPTAPVATLNNPGPAVDDSFGWSVTISGMRVVVGAYQDDTGAEQAGSAYTYDLSNGSPTVPVATLNHLSPAANDNFGNSVAISGSLMVVGAPYDDTGARDAGSVYVYNVGSAMPTLPVIVLNNPNPVADDYFGYAVAISGTRMVIGAYQDDAGAPDSGSAYVYDLSSGTPMVPVATLSNPIPEMDGWFARAVAISGTRVVVGAFRDDVGESEAGSAYVYDLSSGTPTVPVATLNNPSPAADDNFGVSVAISGTRVVVGASQDETGATAAGSAYVYDLSSGTPTVPVVTLNNPSPAASEYFGSSVAISGTRVVIGAYLDDTGATDAGSAYVYDLASATPTVPVVTLNNPSPAAIDYFGTSVAISGARVVVGVIGDDTGSDNAGSAYVYDLSSSTPTEPVATLNNPGPAVQDIFGYSVAIDGTIVVIGTPFDDTVVADKGYAYIFGPSETTTVAPTLLSPATNSVNMSPVNVSFILPETALPGTVKLSFGATVLTLAASQETAGAHSFTVNPDDPTDILEVASGEAIANGTYTVTLSYQDAEGNPAAVAVATGVVIDTATLAPTLFAPATNTATLSPVSVSFSLPEAALPGSVKLNFGATQLTLAASQETSGLHSFTFNPASPTSSTAVASGAAIANGTYTVTLSYRDTRGNLAAGAVSTGVVIDTVTLAPTLLAPAASSATRSPIAVSFTLPETALPGSVKLSFGATVLTLAASQETPGGAGHAFTFDPANPMASPEVASGTAISNGTFTVTLSYRDAVGNVAASASKTGVVVDTVTLAPTLLAPSTNSATRSPVSVSFTLPEAALAGSVKLAFGATQLTLSASQGTSGPHSFTFNPANPTASPQVASGAAIPDGTYAVTLSYQDALGNVAAVASATGVRIDTMTLPPTLTSPVADGISKSPVAVSFSLPETALSGSVKLAFGATQLTLAASQQTSGAHAFTFDPANPVASPEVASGAAVADGVYSVVLSYRDALGNAAAASVAAMNVRVDTVAPVFSLPAAMTVEATSAAGAVVAYTAEASDGGSGVATSGFVPASGSVFPLGTTTVDASATDHAGNMAAGAFTVSVVDTTEPVIGGVFSPLRMVEGTLLPDYAGQAVRSDAVGVASVMQSPPAGTVTSVGPLVVTLTAADAAGNSAETFFTVNVRLVAPVTTAVALAGAPVAGAGSGGIPAGAVWMGFGAPAVNDAGQVAWLGSWRDGAARGRGIFVDGALVAKAGDAAPGLAGVVLKDFLDPVLDEQGRVACRVRLAGTGVKGANDGAILTNGGTGVLRIEAREGDVAPGTGGAVWRSFQSVSMVGDGPGFDGGLVFTAKLTRGKGGPAVSASKDAGAWTNGAGPVELMVREGSPATGLLPGETVRTFRLLSATMGSTGHGDGHASGDVAVFPATTSMRRQVLLAGESGAVSALATAAGATGSTTVPGSLWAGFGAVRPDREARAMAMRAVLREGTAGVVAGNATGIFTTADGGTSWEPVARGGDAAPGLPGVSFRTLHDPVLGVGETVPWVAFVARLGGASAGVTSRNDVSVWTTSGGALELVAREGMPAAEVPAGAVWKNFTSLAAPGGTMGPLFSGQLTTGKGGTQGQGRIASANDMAVWAVDSVGAVRLLFREGDAVAGKTLGKFTVLTAVAGSTGVKRSFSRSGHVTWRATFTDGTTAIVTTDVP